MHHNPTLASFLASIFLSLAAAPVLAINKCEANGKITYSEAPCSQGKATVIAAPPTPSAADVAAAKKVAASDALTLKKIELEKAKEAKLAARADQANARQAAKNAKRAKACAQLEQKWRWAEQDAAKAAQKNQEKLREKAKRMGEKWALECKA